MSRVTSEYTKSYGNWFDNISVIPDAGATVKVEFSTGGTWVEDSASPISEPGTIFVRCSTVRLTPLGGGAWIGDGQGDES